MIWSGATGKLWVLRAIPAVLKVSEVWNDACAKWKVRHGEAAFEWVRAHPQLRLRGVLCSVEQDGVIRNGDAVEILR